MDMNVSAETPGSINRSAFEYKQILDHYLKIKDPDLLIEIFPECIKYGEPEKNTIPYFLGRLAIDSKGAYSKLWGCEKIFNLMRNDRIAAVLEKSCNFRYKDLISLTAETNIFINDNPKNRVFFKKIKRMLRGCSPRLYTQLKKAFNKDNPKG